MKISGVSTPEGARLLGFDSELFGVNVGRVDHPDIDEWAAANAVGCLFLLLDAADTEGIARATDKGFFITDVRLELDLRTRRYPAYGLRDPQPEDMAGLVRIARESHRITRFYADPHFPQERCDDLYEAWIRNSVTGWAAKVFVYGLHRHPLGYVTVHMDGTVGSIGLIAVHGSARGQGIGHQLCRAAIGWAHDHGARTMSTVTQGRNIEALRLFESCGFRMRNTSVWLHRHWPDA